MNKDKKSFYRDRKIDKIVRWFKGKKVEIPILEKPVDNKVTINPNVDTTC